MRTRFAPSVPAPVRAPTRGAFGLLAKLRAAAPATRGPGWGADMEEIARAARSAHVAVSLASGPHTTPVAVVWAAGRLWFLTPRGSVKARAAGRGPVAALLSAGGSTLLLRGRAEVLDPLRPGAAVRAAGTRLLPASLRYLRTQAAETAAITRDALLSLAHDLDTSALGLRSVVALTPVDAVPLGADVPGGAVLTVETARGPLPLPAEWDGRRDRIRLPAAAALLVPGDAERPRACLTVLAEDRPGLHGKSGLLLRGTATFSRDRRTVTLSASRVTWWRGVRTGTLRTAEHEEVPRRHAR